MSECCLELFTLYICPFLFLLVKSAVYQLIRDFFGFGDLNNHVHYFLI